MVKGKTTKMVAFFVALLLSTLSLFGCSPQKDMVKDKIEITPKEEITRYSQETISKAERSIYSLLHLYKEHNSQKITTEIEANMSRQAQSVANDTAGIIKEESYLLILEKINNNSEKIVEGVSQIRTTSLLDGLNTLTPIYKEISSLDGKELVGEIIYSLAMCTFDIKYDKQMASYEIYGEKYILDKANEYLKAKEVLANDIGISNVNTLVEYAFVYVELLVGGAFDGSPLSDFSNDEIAIFIKRLELDKITISEKGWTMLFAIYGEGTVKNLNSSFFNRALFSATQNGDVAELGRSTHELISILSLAQKRLLPSDIALLRENKTDELVASVFGKLTDEEWTFLDKSMPKDFDYDKYVDLAKKYYGKDFEAYLSTCETADINELKASQGTDDFNKTLKEYIAGICPAFSYDIDF
ncbi:MAG: hypothetical protein IJ437_02310 [Clostridia bacterium]|nr:hypothetical protein [Clostridia bacterium]